MEVQKRKMGRPPVTEEQRLVVTAMRLTREQLRQYHELGGAVWFREAIRRAYARKFKKGREASTSSA